MSVWTERAVEAAVVGALGQLHLNNPDGHHFGRPFLTAYQLAIKVDSAHPEIRQALASELGGAGIGVHHSFAQYLARELSRRIRRASEAGEGYPVEGAFVSKEHLVGLTYRATDGHEVTSSLTGSGYDLSLFRLRDQ